MGGIQDLNDKAGDALDEMRDDKSLKDKAKQELHKEAEEKTEE